MQWPTPGHFPSNHARPVYVAAAAAVTAVEAARAMCDCPVVTCFSAAAARSARLGYALNFVGWLADVIA